MAKSPQTTHRQLLFKLEEFSVNSLNFFLNKSANEPIKLQEIVFPDFLQTQLTDIRGESQLDNVENSLL